MRSYALLLFICNLFCVNSEVSIKPSSHSLATPIKIPRTAFPRLKEYHIRTRIVIEGMPLDVLNEDTGEKTSIIWWAHDLKDVIKEIKFTETLYSNLGIKIHIIAVDLRINEANPINFKLDAVKYEDVLTIRYMLPNILPFAGLGSGPWESVDTGILLAWNVHSWTLAHEFGHWLGLLHTFNSIVVNGDLVSDTPEQKNCYLSDCEIGKAENEIPNCKNIMSYCLHSGKYITKGQEERARRFLRASRSEYVMLNPGSPLFTLK